MSALIVDDYTPCHYEPGVPYGHPDWQPNPFDILIDSESGPEWRAARREALSMCNICPAQAACWTKAAADEEPWIDALAQIAERRVCEYCGATFTLKKRGGGKRFCNNACSLANRRAQGLVGEGVALEELRQHHATYIRHKAAGDSIPAEVLEGERGYQATRKRQARAREKAA